MFGPNTVGAGRPGTPCSGCALAAPAGAADTAGMARYGFRCPNGHETELVLPMGGDVPESTECICDETAARVWEPPAAIHYRGRGFYSTDVKGAQERRRRKNPGDKLPAIHDPVAAAIARSL